MVTFHSSNFFIQLSIELMKSGDQIYDTILLPMRNLSITFIIFIFMTVNNYNFLTYAEIVRESFI